MDNPENLPKGFIYAQMTEMNSDVAFAELLTPIQLPCGRIVHNRLVKVAMYEHMCNLFGGPPNPAHLELYTRWSKGQWGMICTGNVQVAKDHLTLGRDLVVPEQFSSESIEPFRQLADVIHGDQCSCARTADEQSRALAIMQLSHPGRQSANILGGRWPFVPPSAPSAIAVGRTPSKTSSRASSILSYALHKSFFQTPRPLSVSDIDAVVDSFVRGARLAGESGFDGVELHAAHGYLISQFMSTKTNLREDDYSAHVDPLRFLYRIVSAIREPGVVPNDFVLGIKLNAADYVDSNKASTADDDIQSQQERVFLQHLRRIASWGMVDFVQISGGDYEDPAFMTETRSLRQALFTRFAHQAVQTLESQPESQHAGPATDENSAQTASLNPRPPPLIILTGGLRTLPLLSSALANKHANLLGVGRLAVVYPELPRILSSALSHGGLDSKDAFLMEPFPEPDLTGLGIGLSVDAQTWWQVSWDKLERTLVAMLISLWAHIPLEFPKLVGAGTDMAWHMVMMRRIAVGREVDYSVGGLAAVLRMWIWLAPAKGSTQHNLRGSCISMGILGVVIGFIIGIVYK